MYFHYLLLFTILSSPSFTTILQSRQQQIVDILSQNPLQEKLLENFLTSGAMGGYFTTDEILETFTFLSERYKTHVERTVIGKTSLKAEMLAFRLSDNVNSKYQKSQVLFTALHHAREVLSGNMMVKLLLRILHGILHGKSEIKFFKFNDILMVPIVNIDGHQLISKAYGTSAWEARKEKRKNMNSKYCQNSDENVLTGVDLNRNYGYHFGNDPSDAQPCSETYRGPHPFSEPETQAIKEFTLRHPTIVSAMNFHSYGNIWIHPFNYMKKKNAYPKHLEPTVVNFYEQFKLKIGIVSDGDSGTAYDTVSYATDGEGSDWMLGERKIISFSPELGTGKGQEQNFYPPKESIWPALQENYAVIKEFLLMNEFSPRDLSYGFDQREYFVFTFFQEQLANIYQPDLLIEDPGSDFVSGVESIQVESRLGEIAEAQFEKTEGDTRLRISLQEIVKLQNFKLTFRFKNGATWSPKTELLFSFKMPSGYNFWEVKLRLADCVKRQRILALLTPKYIQI